MVAGRWYDATPVRDRESRLCAQPARACRSFCFDFQAFVRVCGIASTCQGGTGRVSPPNAALALPALLSSRPPPLGLVSSQNSLFTLSCGLAQRLSPRRARKSDLPPSLLSSYSLFRSRLIIPERDNETFCSSPPPSFSFLFSFLFPTRDKTSDGDLLIHLTTLTPLHEIGPEFASTHLN